jgi:hypothetical protein
VGLGVDFVDFDKVATQISGYRLLDSQRQHDEPSPAKILADG